MSAVTQPFEDAIAKGRARFAALQPRERWVFVGGSLILLSVILYSFVWQPVTNAHRRRVDALAQSRALAARLEQAAVKVQVVRSGSRAGAMGATQTSLVAAVDQSSRQGGLGKPPTRLQPEGDKEVRVWFEDVGFDPTVRWLAELQNRYGISVQTLDVEARDQPGSVNLHLSLVRGQ